MSQSVKYKIVGRRGVGVYRCGQVVDGGDLVGVNIQALLDGGHIVVEAPKHNPVSVKEEE
jgi:hypothetical protein